MSPLSLFFKVTETLLKPNLPLLVAPLTPSAAVYPLFLHLVECRLFSASERLLAGYHRLQRQQREGSRPIRRSSKRSLMRYEKSDVLNR